MVKYVRIGNLEFARKEEAPTVDDPVGNYLFKRFQKGSKGKIEIGRMKKSYLEALEYFESGAMLREEYEALLKKAKPSSFTQRREELKASRLLQSDFVREIFGDVNKLHEAERSELVSACQNVTKLKKFVKPYLEKRVDEISDDFANFREKILETFRTQPLDELGFVFSQLKNVIIGNIDFNYGPKVRYSPDRTLFNRYCQITHGNVFNMSKFYNEMVERFGKKV